MMIKLELRTIRLVTLKNCFEWPSTAIFVTAKLPPSAMVKGALAYVPPFMQNFTVLGRSF